VLHGSESFYLKFSRSCYEPPQIYDPGIQHEPWAIIGSIGIKIKEGWILKSEDSLMWGYAKTSGGRDR